MKATLALALSRREGIPVRVGRSGMLPLVLVPMLPRKAWAGARARAEAKVLPVLAELLVGCAVLLLAKV